jgi:cell division protease FtsH
VNNGFMRNGFVYLVVVVAVLAVLFMAFRQDPTAAPASYSSMLASVATDVQTGGRPELVISGNSVEYRRNNVTVQRVAITTDTDVVRDLNVLGLNLAGEQVVVEYKQPGQFGSVLTILGSFLPILFIVGLLIFMMRQAQGSNNQAMSFGRSKARMISGHRTTVTFKDVQGVDEAKQELAEVVEFLKYPEKFTKIGARIPSGVLLIGPPGTGKTYLAKAVAGEAGVPFFNLSGSEFVEMFVGVGASRVRDLFEKARQNAPCLIFVDEIDAVGRQRGAGLGGSHDEREQTLNQILVEMDGFESETNVIVLAATNRPDILDPALLRPGRFDRQVILDRPDIRGREAILQVHAEGKPLESDVDLMVVAKETSGFTGADLENLLNEGAILAARANKRTISMEELEEAIDRVVAGPQRKGRVISVKEKRITAFHEIGHALVGHFMGEMDPVHKISIIARGKMGGYTRFLPPEDRSMMSQSQFEDQIATMMGGRAAELLVFDEVTTGASSDLERSTDIARQMVTRYGMSRKLGPRTFGKTNELVFLGRDIAETRNYSEAVAEQIDDEVTEIIMRAHERATEVLRSHREHLDTISEYLLEQETMDMAALEALLRGEELPEPSSDPPLPAPEPEEPSPEQGNSEMPPAGRRIVEEPGGAA